MFDGVAFTAVGGVGDEADLREIAADEVGGVVVAAVVDDDDLEWVVLAGEVVEAVAQCVADSAGFVVGGDYER